MSPCSWRCLVVVEEERQVDEVPPGAAILRHILMIDAEFRIAHLVGPGCRMGEDPLVFFPLVPALDLPGHGAFEMRLEARMGSD